METVEELRSLWKVPCIAHFCSLFRGVLFEQSDLDIEDLEEALLRAKSPGDSPIILDLLCSLLEGIYDRRELTVVDYDRYLKDIFRINYEAGNIKENPLVDKTFFELSLHDKVEVLHSLCDFRLDSADVMEVLKGHDGDNMRVEPLGHDVNGATYWYFYGTRLYQEDPEPKEAEEKSPKHGKHSKKKKKKKSEREERMDKRRAKKKEVIQEVEAETENSPKKLRKSKRNAQKSICALYRNEIAEEGVEDNFSLANDLQGEDDSSVLNDGKTGSENTDIHVNTTEEIIQNTNKLHGEDDSSVLNDGKTGSENTNVNINTTEEIIHNTDKPVSEVTENMDATCYQEENNIEAAVCSILSDIKIKIEKEEMENCGKIGKDDIIEVKEEEEVEEEEEVKEEHKEIKEDEKNVVNGHVEVKVKDDEDKIKVEPVELKTEVKVEMNVEAKENVKTEVVNLMKGIVDKVESNEMIGETMNDLLTEIEKKQVIDEGVVNVLNDILCKIELTEMVENVIIDIIEKIEDANKDNVHQSSESSALKMEAVTEKENDLLAAECIAESPKAQEEVPMETESIDQEPKDHDPNMELIESVPEPMEAVEVETEVQDAEEGDVDDDEEGKDIEEAGSKRDDEDVSEREYPSNEKDVDEQSTSLTANNVLVDDQASVGENDNSMTGGDASMAEVNDKQTMEENEEMIDNKLLEENKNVPERVDTEESTSTTPKPNPVSRWHMVCSTLEDWQNLSEFFRESEAKCEKALYKTIVEDFLPEIPNIIVEREKELVRRLAQNLPRRHSSRLEVKRIQQEEIERLQAAQEQEDEKTRLVEEEKRMERVRQERVEEQKRAREERERVREERANRIKKREERARLLSEGIEIPEELQNLDSPVPETEVRIKNLKVDNEVTVTMFKVLDSIKSHQDSWLFWEPVEETFAPGYFDVIKKPMDLMRIENKVNNREYQTTDEFFDDLHLMFDNCILYNGSDSDYAYMAQSLRSHLKKVYKRLLPKEDDPDYIPEQELPSEPTEKTQTMTSIKPKKKLKKPDYHAVFEKKVYKDMVKFPPTPNAGTFKHGNYIVHMTPVMRKSKEKIFAELDKETEALRATQGDKYKKLPLLGTIPVRSEIRPPIDLGDTSLAGRFKRKVDPTKVLNEAGSTPAKKVAVGTPRVETIASPQNPGVKKNVWHISQEDMAKYKKIAQENNGFVEIKGTDGKTLKLQFKSGPVKPAASGATAAQPGVACQSAAAQPAPAEKQPEKSVKVSDTSVKPSIETQAQTQSESSSTNSTPPTTANQKEATTPQEIHQNSTQTKPENYGPKVKVQLFDPEATLLNRTVPDVSENTDNSTDTEMTKIKPRLVPESGNKDEASPSQADRPVDEPDPSLQTHSISVQAAVDVYPDRVGHGAELTNGNRKKPKYEPFKKKTGKVKVQSKKQSLDILEKKLRETHSMADPTAEKPVKNTNKTNKSKNNKSNSLNGVIIRGVHHENGVKRKHEKTKDDADVSNVSLNKGDKSNFDDEDDVPMKKVWHPVQQSPDKMKLVICRSRKDDSETSSLSPTSPKPGILKKLGSNESSPLTNIKEKVVAEPEVANTEIECEPNDGPSSRKKKRVSFSDKLSVCNLPPVATASVSKDSETLKPVKPSATPPPAKRTPSKSAKIHSAMESQTSSSSSSTSSFGTGTLTTMQQKIKKLKSESAPSKYVCDFDSDDSEELPPFSKPPEKKSVGNVPRRPCSYLKTSSCSTLLNKPHEFSVNAPASAPVVTKVSKGTSAADLDRPKVTKPTQQSDRLVSVSIQTEKPNSPVEHLKKDACVGPMEEEAPYINKPILCDAAVETKDLSTETDVSDAALLEAEVEIDPAEKKRAESLIQSIAEEIRQPGEISNIAKRKNFRSSNLPKMKNAKSDGKQKVNSKTVTKYKSDTNDQTIVNSEAGEPSETVEKDIANPPLCENNGEPMEVKDPEVQPPSPVEYTQSEDNTVLPSEENSEKSSSLENFQEPTELNEEIMETGEGFESVTDAQDAQPEDNLQESNEGMEETSEYVDEIPFQDVQPEENQDVEMLEEIIECEPQIPVNDARGETEGDSGRTEAEEKFISLVADYADDHEKVEEEEEAEQIEETVIEENTVLLPTLDKELPITNEEMPTLEDFEDSSMPELSPAYQEVKDGDEMPVLEETCSKDVNATKDIKASDSVKKSCETETSSVVVKKTIETPVKESQSPSTKPKTPSSSEKKYRDREHPFFNDPAMISLYSPDSPGQQVSTKTNLIDSFMLLGRTESSVSTEKNNVSEPASSSSSSSSASSSSSTSSNVQTPSSEQSPATDTKSCS